MIDTDGLQARFLNSIAEIERQPWNLLAGDASPFLRHEFLLALETTGCTTREAGWQPCHLLLTDSAGKPQGAVPLYLKNNSYGEYVFDWSWADAYRSAGLNYYPKFLSAVPFTPSVGPRLLIAEGVPPLILAQAAVSAIQAEAQRRQVSSWHVLFLPEEQNALLQQQGMLSRSGCQFHWFNHGYSSFDDFLAALNSRKRKNIRKERQAVREQGICFELIEGSEITEAHWQKFYGFYQTNYHQRGMQGYLTPAFFRQIARDMPDNVLLVLAEAGHDVIAGALFFKDSRRLYGRYWGSSEEYQFLHFEACFYQGIDYCIHHGLEEFDAGAQGEHKIQRGFEPVLTSSCHWIASREFSVAIERFLQQEQAYIKNYRAEAIKYLPFKKADPD